MWRSIDWKEWPRGALAKGSGVLEEAEGKNGNVLIRQFNVFGSDGEERRDLR
jgi:hypothetical protein